MFETALFFSQLLYNKPKYIQESTTVKHHWFSSSMGMVKVG
uniref:Uncharacterized protein n=1 Tax=Anguilla anguilla TaxID=7936 RepID=A0A0E9W2Q9_ANGAN